MSEGKEKKKGANAELKYPLPDKRISLDSHFDIIKAYVVASNNGKNPAGYKELEPFNKIITTLVSGCNKFFENLEIITKSEVGKYLPTEKGIDLCKALQWKDENLIKEAMQKIVESTWFWNQTKQYLMINEHVTRDELIQKIGLNCEADPQKHTRSLDKLIEYMMTAKLIVEKDGKFILGKTEKHENGSKPKILLDPNKVEESKSNIVKPVYNSSEINMSFGLLINPETSEEQIRKSIRVIVDELEKIQQEKTENSQ